jgi:riboflavin kinase/FMN adenylyltransferase
VTTDDRRVAQTPADLPPIGPAVLTMGVFDGVHRGHRALLDATRAAATSLGVSSLALVFDPPPDEVLRPGTRVPRLLPPTTVVHRIETDVGLDHALLLRFDDVLRQLTADEFLAALASAITLRAIVMSPESAFGRGRGGTVARMREIGGVDGFEVITVEPVLHAGEPISSRRIREAIEGGDLATARALGSAARLEGTAEPRGSHIGLAFTYLPAMPPPGRYTAMLAADGHAGGSATVSLGRPADVRLDDASSARVRDGQHLALDLEGSLSSVDRAGSR